MYEVGKCSKYSGIKSLLLLERSNGVLKIGNVYLIAARWECAIDKFVVYLLSKNLLNACHSMKYFFLLPSTVIRPDVSIAKGRCSASKGSKIIVLYIV